AGARRARGRGLGRRNGRDGPPRDLRELGAVSPRRAAPQGQRAPRRRGRQVDLVPRRRRPDPVHHQRDRRRGLAGLPAVDRRAARPRSRARLERRLLAGGRAAPPRSGGRRRAGAHVSMTTALAAEVSVESLASSGALPAEYEAIFVSGSVIEGWGHANSDLDVYVITDHPVAGERVTF